MLKYTFIFCLLALLSAKSSQADEKPTPTKEAPATKGTSGMLTEIKENEIVLWVSSVKGDVGIDYGINIPLTKETKYYLDEIEASGKKDEKGNDIPKTTRKEITLKDLKEKQGATVTRDEKGNAATVIQTVDKRPAPKDKLTPAPIKN